MKLPRVRLILRRMMFVVLILAMMIEGWIVLLRSSRFANRIRVHEELLRFHQVRRAVVQAWRFGTGNTTRTLSPGEEVELASLGRRGV